jgi:hypothetical protein
MEHRDDEDYPEYDPPEPTPAYPPDMSVEDPGGSYRSST